MPPTASVLPPHLPRRLAIAFWEWPWATDCQPGEPFHDLEGAMRDLVARGFNAIRIDAFWSWAFDREGRRRGPIEVGSAAEPGYSDYGPALTTRGGARFDALEKVLRLFELAERYDVYIILTSWEYQPGHSAGFLADPAIREDILGVPAAERFVYLATQCDRLLQAIKGQGLEKRIAYVEIHNEIEYSAARDFPGGAQAARLAIEKGLAFLRARHPDLLFTDDNQVNIPPDYSFDYKIAQAFLDKVAANAQVLDHHLYCGGVQFDLFRQAGLANWGNMADAEMERVTEQNDLFRWLLKPDAPAWAEYKRHTGVEWFRPWKPLMYLYQYLDVEHYDYWMFRHYPEWEERMRTFWKNYIQMLGAHAQQRGVPIVCDEGYIFWPPMQSRFETSAVGKSNFEFIVGHMLEANYWGIMISTYTWPGQPLWDLEADWLKKVNDSITRA